MSEDPWYKNNYGSMPKWLVEMYKAWEYKDAPKR
jgi:hypothetical protein